MKFHPPHILIAVLLIGVGLFLTLRARQTPHANPASVAAPPRAEWPEFRGPTQDGHSTATGLPTEWGPEKNIVWKTPLPGKAWSSPIVAGARNQVANAEPPPEGHELHD